MVESAKEIFTYSTNIFIIIIIFHIFFQILDFLFSYQMKVIRNNRERKEKT